MATVRAVAGATSGGEQWSLSRGIKDYLSCCFVSTTSGSSSSVDKKTQLLSVSSEKEVDGEDELDVANTNSAVVSQKNNNKKTPLRPHRDKLAETYSYGSTSDAASVTSSVLAAAERRSADGASIRSAMTDESGPRVARSTSHVMRTNSDGGVTGQRRPTAADGTTRNTDDENQSQASSGHESSSSTIARYYG